MTVPNSSPWLFFHRYEHLVRTRRARYSIMIFFMRAGRFIKSLPRVRFLRPFAIRLDWGHDNVVEGKGGMIATIRLYGSRNRIELPKTSSFTGHITVHGEGNRILIGENGRLTGQLMVKKAATRR
ncbi:hypothetical protein [Rhizobium herbae]|uniref:Uncharacterized protein n=1 Tax=Rhizobium herbae TaxID=508661 RepID=A0ABS4EK95_9HYPH|nr:hypothetical protein [Rhizobium herbae]MBP1858261.1 hypothetical protein [Rhizobium herbae]